MFRATRAFSGFSVDDLQAAEAFYSQTLELQVSEVHGLLTLHIAGDRDIIVYPKPDHTPATCQTSRQTPPGKWWSTSPPRE
jgi:catechol 2,3-dioxygenase-like lactoylglutathione lyase family enzyme